MLLDSGFEKKLDDRDRALEGLNVELLLQTLALIQAQPERWYQGSFYSVRKVPGGGWRSTEAEHENDCGTACCFAGWAVAINDRREPRRYGDGSDAIGANHISVRAMRLLGLTAYEAAHLFSASNTMGKIEQYVHRIVDGEFRTPKFLDTFG